MAREKDADSAATVTRILEAASELLETEPLERFSVRGVARVSRLSVGTIAYYFKNREELLEACLDDYHRRVAELAKHHMERVPAGESPERVLEDATREFFRFGRKHRTLVRLQLSRTALSGGLSAQRLQGEVAFHKQFMRVAEIGGRRLALDLQTVVFAGVRYACASSDELCALVGASDEAEAESAMALYLGRCARRLLTAPDPAEEQAP
ncbi:MAG: TetR family transcriptional regulator [Polyangiaceae bacterium]